MPPCLQNAEINEVPVLELPGMCWFAAVLNLCAGYRMRLFVMTDENAETDLSENEARAVFESLADETTWQMAKEIMAIACKGERA